MPRIGRFKERRRTCLNVVRFVTLFGVGFLFSDPCLGRDMQGRLGLGYNSEFANAYSTGPRVPGISIKYAMTRDLAIEGVFAIATTSPSQSVTGIKLFKNVFFETNLNFYFMLGGGFINANSQIGAELLAGFGAEFFIPGIDSLGLAIETGATFNNASGSYALRTLGVSFLDAGIHFYF